MMKLPVSPPLRLERRYAQGRAGHQHQGHYARSRINGLHLELVALRLKLGEADLDGMMAREREIKEAEARGRAGGEAVSVGRNLMRPTPARDNLPIHSDVELR